MCVRERECECACVECEHVRVCVSVRACMCNIRVNLQRVSFLGHVVSLGGDLSDGGKQSFLAWG